MIDSYVLTVVPHWNLGEKLEVKNIQVVRQIYFGPGYLIYFLV